MKLVYLLVGVAVLLCLLPDEISSAHSTCKRDWKKVGCFNDKNGQNNELRTLKEILLTDRDPTMKQYTGGHIDWKNWPTYVHGLACRCAAAAREKGYKMFGLQYAGECWAGADDEKRYNMYGAATDCFDHLSNPVQPCNNKIETECMGLRNQNYIYRLSQDGGYSQWSNFSDCSVTCGEGVVTRTRTCTNPPPSAGGKSCEGLGPATESKVCVKPVCPVDGGYTPWSKFSECSVTCGTGVQSRARTCTNPKPVGTGKDCSGLGASSETKECVKPKCATNGNYSNWSPFSECPVTCGTGVQLRKRTCTNPAPLNGGDDCIKLGPSAETKECATNMCPSPCKLPKIFDVGLAIDVSTSIGKEHFKSVNKFIERFVAQFDIGTNLTHIGMLVYSTKAKLLHNLSNPKYHTLANLEKAARNVPYFQGGTRTDYALEMASKKFFKAKTDRKYPNVLIVLTDGNTSRKSKPYSEVLAPLKAQNVRVMAVGIGAKIDTSELNVIAMGNKKHAIQVADFDQLIANMDELLDEACEGKA